MTFEIVFFNKNILCFLYFVFIWYHMHFFKWLFFSIIDENLDKDEVQCIFKRHIEELCILIWWKQLSWLYGSNTLISKIILYWSRQGHTDFITILNFLAGLKQARSIRWGQGAWSHIFVRSKYFFFKWIIMELPYNCLTVLRVCKEIYFFFAF